MKNNISDIYKCEICGNIVEIIHPGDESLVCCGDPMTKLHPIEGPEGAEKHIPIIKTEGNHVTVTVGSIPHPMLDEHYIEWVELIIGDKAQKVFLHPGMEPKATFCVGKNDEKLFARIHCNIHGLWVSE